MNRGEAIRLKLRHYNTGKPCKYGHVADRYTPSGACTECLKSQRATTGMARGTLTLPALALHPDDFRAVMDLVDYLLQARGMAPVSQDLAAAMRPTPWEEYLEAEIKKPLERRMSLIDMMATAMGQGMVEEYRPGHSRPVDTWSDQAAVYRAAVQARQTLLGAQDAPMPAGGYTAEQLGAMPEEEQARARFLMVREGIPVPQLWTDDDGSAPRNPYA